ncbi:hypothetical protein GCM10023322_77770 [Rugosimonospora acidiphila]|uniref:Tetratricopeptide repeat protein n=1 Tax=Rugosimonospora acidiphila TaxID=556531 RepID=A0ABP9ST30_9ACTN
MSDLSRHQVASLHTLAQRQQARAQWDAALETLRRAERIAHDAGVTGGAQLLSTERMLAEVLRELGDLPEAHRLAAALVPRCERLLGAGHPGTVRARAVLATVLYDSGDRDHAYALCRQVLESGKGTDGPAARAMLLTQSNLARLHHDRGEHDLALAMLHRVHDTFRRRYGDEDLDTLRLAAQLAGLHLAAGDRQTARQLLTRAHHRTRALLGSGHPLTERLEARLAEVEPPMPTHPEPEAEPPRRRRWLRGIRSDGDSLAPDLGHDSTVDDRSRPHPASTRDTGAAERPEPSRDAAIPKAPGAEQTPGGAWASGGTWASDPAESAGRHAARPAHRDGPGSGANPWAPPAAPPRFTDRRPETPHDKPAPAKENSPAEKPAPGQEPAPDGRNTPDGRNAPVPRHAAVPAAQPVAESTPPSAARPSWRPWARERLARQRLVWQRLRAQRRLAARRRAGRRLARQRTVAHPAGPPRQDRMPPRQDPRPLRQDPTPPHQDPRPPRQDPRPPHQDPTLPRQQARQAPEHQPLAFASGPPRQPTRSAPTHQPTASGPPRSRRQPQPWQRTDQPRTDRQRTVRQWPPAPVPQPQRLPPPLRERNRGLRRYGKPLVLSAAALGAAAGVAAAVILVAPSILPGPHRAGEALDRSPTSARPTAMAPAGLAMRDHGGSITVSWVDPSKGSATAVVTLSHNGTPVGSVVSLKRGVTSYTATHLDPTGNYCFLIALLAPGETTASPTSVCTTRRPATVTTPTTAR